MEREKVAEVLLDFMEWNKAEFRTTLSISCFHRKNNLGDLILITLPQAKIGF